MYSGINDVAKIFTFESLITAVDLLISTHVAGMGSYSGRDNFLTSSSSIYLDRSYLDNKFARLYACKYVAFIVLHAVKL